MLDDRIELLEADVLRVGADTIIVEDGGDLRAVRGLAAELDRQDATLAAQRARAVAERGTFAIGAALAVQAQAVAASVRAVVYAVTWAEATGGRVRATPLDVAEATTAALVAAVTAGAQHVALPALGTRLGYNVLPPTPKKLPRYVMGAAQLIGVRQALALVALDRVTICLTQRDLQIFLDLIGQGGAQQELDDE